jgi:hypothetical protein
MLVKLGHIVITISKQLKVPDMNTGHNPKEGSNASVENGQSKAFQ